MQIFSFFVLIGIFSTSIGKYLLLDLDPKKEVSKDSGKMIKANRNKDSLFFIKYSKSDKRKLHHTFLLISELSVDERCKDKKCGESCLPKSSVFGACDDNQQCVTLFAHPGCKRNKAF